MNTSEFRIFWSQNYPYSIAMGHKLRNSYTDRWFRIHSLPESKRYAETQAEYEIILTRQNELITDIIGNNEPIIILFSLYENDIANSNYEKIKDIKEFKKVDSIQLKNINPKEYDEDDIQHIFIKITEWNIGERNDLLKLIADDQIRMLFINLNNKRIISPYDGGVDIILENSKAKTYYKEKYREWLSKHKEGL